MTFVQPGWLEGKTPKKTPNLKNALKSQTSISNEVPEVPLQIVDVPVARQSSHVNEAQFQPHKAWHLVHVMSFLEPQMRRSEIISL